MTPIGIIVLALLLLLIGGSKILAARRRVREDLEEVEAGARTGHEHEAEMAELTHGMQTFDQALVVSSRAVW